MEPTDFFRDPRAAAKAAELHESMLQLAYITGASLDEIRKVVETLISDCYSDSQAIEALKARALRGISIHDRGMKIEHFEGCAFLMDIAPKLEKLDRVEAPLNRAQRRAQKFGHSRRV